MADDLLPPSRSQREIVLVETSALAAAMGHAPISLSFCRNSRERLFFRRVPPPGVCAKGA